MCLWTDVNHVHMIHLIWIKFKVIRNRKSFLKLCFLRLLFSCYFCLGGQVSGSFRMWLNPNIPLFQESISDFYWYYSGKDVIDEQGQRNFSKAIQVAKQVFNTLTEYIQVNIYISAIWRKKIKESQLVSTEFHRSIQYAYFPAMIHICY